MGFDSLQYTELSDICANFPVTPIEDDDSYQAVIEILDRLFARDELRTPAESEYFRTLAQMASDYEINRDDRRVRGHHLGEVVVAGQALRVPMGDDGVVPLTEP